jgi:cation transport ATPase
LELELETLNAFGDIGNIVQLAVAPVFLLTGIAAFLGVLSNRLGRITDRARVLERRRANISGDRYTLIEKELASLWRRINMINKAIRLCTSSALLVCLVVVMLFLGGLSPFDLSILVAVFFIAAMVALIVGLIYFLREVTKATRSSQIGMEIAVDDIHLETKE